MFKYWFFAFLVISELYLCFVVIYSLLVPSKYIYPPPREKSWQNYSVLIIHHPALIGFFVLGILDWNSFILESNVFLILGIILEILGWLFGIWGGVYLGLRKSAGYDVGLVNTGPYKFSRNPQIVGLLVAYIGYFLLTNSLLVLIVVILSITWYILSVFCEERWLTEKIGAEYKEYLKKTRRFL